MTLRHAIPFVALAFAGCVPPAQAPAAAPDGAAPSPALARLAGDDVLVLPVRATADTTARPSGAPDSLAVALDAALREALAPVVARGWVWADQLRQLHRRNPLSVPDPTRLRIEPSSVMRAGVTLPQDVATDIRRLLSVSGARRYVLATFLGVGRPARTAPPPSAVAMLVLIDARVAEVADVAFLSAPTGSVRQTAAGLAAAARQLVVPN